MIDDAFGYWLSGLIDGEGCFRIKGEKRFTHYSTSFALKLRDDDAQLLDLIADVTEIGRVKADRSRSGNSNPCAVWVVDTKAGCEALLKILRSYPLRSRKARDLMVWAEAVEWRAASGRGNRWHGPIDWAPMAEFKRRLEEAREYRGEVVPT